MTIESATYIGDLDANNPAAGDAKSEGDDHIRLIKACALLSFPTDFRNMTTATNIRFGQMIKWDGSGWNVNVRGRFTEYETTSNQSVTIGSYAAFEFPNTPSENGLALTYVSPGKATVTTHNRHLAFRFRGNLLVTGAAPLQYLGLKVFKNAGTQVGTTKKFYPGLEAAASAYASFEFYFLVPALTSTDTLYLHLTYDEEAGTAASVVSLLAGASLQFVDRG